jgi:hypothetical protein
MLVGRLSALAEFRAVSPTAGGRITDARRAGSHYGSDALDASSAGRHLPAFQSLLVISSMVRWSLL